MLLRGLDCASVGGLSFLKEEGQHLGMLVMRSLHPTPTPNLPPSQKGWVYGGGCMKEVALTGMLLARLVVRYGW